MDKSLTNQSPSFLISTILLVLAWLYVTASNLSNKDEVLQILQKHGGHFAVPFWTNSIMWWVTTMFWAMMMMYLVSCAWRTVTDFRTKLCYIYDFGHIQWVVHATALLGLILHHHWQYCIQYGSLGSATLAIVFATVFMLTALYTQLQHLEDNVIALWRESLKLDIQVMYYVVIQALDLYSSWLSYLMLSTLDAYLVSTGVAPKISNFIIMMLTTSVLVTLPMADEYVFNRWRHYLIGGYLTYFLGPLGTISFQIKQFKPLCSGVLCGLALLPSISFKCYSLITNPDTKSGFKRFYLNAQ